MGKVWATLGITTVLLSITSSAKKVMASVCNGNELSGVFSVSYVTTPNEDVAKSLANVLVKEKLAGCVNIIPGVQSIYEWKGEIQNDSEVLMIIKSRTSRLDDLTRFIRENHPYEVCEVISTPINHGNIAYLHWLRDAIPDEGTK